MTAINYKQLVEDLVAEARSLRLEAEAAEERFLLFLMSIEREHMPDLETLGINTFERFLKSYELCEPARYRDRCLSVH
jgi:hypothetical protein